MSAQPDPASLLWDSAAQIVLERAYAARGQWVGVRIADPSARQAAGLLALGITALGRDNPSAIGGRRGGLDARDRWRRAFVRALYRANKANGNRPIQVEVGRKLPRRGVVPPGRPVRVRLRRGGSVAMRAVDRKPDSGRIWVGDHEPGQRFSNPDLRDW